ncbi:MAG TPA: mycothiol synthase [Dehalococcoidia bacterium]|jgi:mycothiol synthase
MHHIEIVSRLEDPHLEELPPLLEAASYADGHEPIGEHKFLRLRRGEDLAVALLAYEHGALTGYAHTVTYGEEGARRVSCEFVVHPEQRGRGIGGRLLAAAIETAQSQGASKIDVWAYNDSSVSARMAGAYGFTPARRLLHLHRHLTAATFEVAPSGVDIRSFVPGVDDERWLELNNRIFRGHPENGAWTIDDLHARMAQPWFDANDLLMLEIEGVLAGFCWLKVEQRGDAGRVGEIYVVGTAPECRGMGLGRFLVGRALAHLRERDVQLAAIYVDESNRAALALYEQAGFHHHHVDVCYSRALAARDGVRADGVAA